MPWTQRQASVRRLQVDHGSPSATCLRFSATKSPAREERGGILSQWLAAHGTPSVSQQHRWRSPEPSLAQSPDASRQCLAAQCRLSGGFSRSSRIGGCAQADPPGVRCLCCRREILQVPWPLASSSRRVRIRITQAFWPQQTVCGLNPSVSLKEMQVVLWRVLADHRRTCASRPRRLIRLKPPQAEQWEVFGQGLAAHYTEIVRERHPWRRPEPPLAQRPEWISQRLVAQYRPSKVDRT